MGKSQRAKGVTGELEVAHLFQAKGFSARRGIGQWQSASACPDVILNDLHQYWIEVKRGAETKPLEALDQAEAACKNKIPIAITRRDREKHWVTMRAIDWQVLRNQVMTENPLVRVIMPFSVFIEVFCVKHADKCKQLEFKLTRDTTTVDSSAIRSDLNSENSAVIENQQTDMFKPNV
jgi:Holliday junction resolvase